MRVTCLLILNSDSKRLVVITIAFLQCAHLKDWVQAHSPSQNTFPNTWMTDFIFTTVALSAGYTLQLGMHAFHNG